MFCPFRKRAASEVLKKSDFLRKPDSEGGGRTVPATTPTGEEPGEGSSMQDAIHPQQKKVVYSVATVSDDNKEEKLNVKHLTKAVRTLVLPPVELILIALEQTVNDIKPQEGWSKHGGESDSIREDTVLLILTSQTMIKRKSPFEFFSHYPNASLLTASVSLNLKERQRTDIGLFFGVLGGHFYRLCNKNHQRALSSLGSNLQDFLNSLDALQELVLKQKENYSESSEEEVPSYRCVSTTPDALHLYYQPANCSSNLCISPFVVGVVRKIAKTMFDLEVKVNAIQDNKKGSVVNGGKRSLHYKIHAVNQGNNKTAVPRGLFNTPSQVSTKANDLQLSLKTMCRMLPWHFIFGRQMTLQQLGSAIIKVLSPRVKHQRGKISSYFQVLQPKVDFDDFCDVEAKINNPFRLAFRDEVLANKYSKMKGMEIKGQMVHCSESDCIIFIGSPLVDGLDGLTGSGLYISDIPIHDATRDVVLVGEQSRAQDGLKRRLDNIRSKVEEASKAVEVERKKNVDLLHLIFPPDIAKRLWLEQTIEAQEHDDVTMLFSDIVGFTSICSTATPFMVINMLNSLYTQFDKDCGLLDVYKIETIGDAYCVAGGLHKRSPLHAQQVAWMAIRMMEKAKKEKAHDGKPIQLRIGLHSSSVLAGVVGVTMPRYCLFGNNVTVANKFESGSEPLRINISPTTYELLKTTPGFSFTARPRECLPKGFPPEIPGTCHFLDDYIHPKLAQVNGDALPEEKIDSITLAIQEYTIGGE
ncbi:hypothetical protein CHUAL_011971 [Chamberlinius hualienensis]